MLNILLNLLTTMLAIIGIWALIFFALFLIIFDFHKIPIRGLMKKFLNGSDALEKLIELSTINRAYSIRADVRERILDRLLKRPPTSPFVPEGVNRSQWIDERYYQLKKELKKMGVENWKVKIFL